jgi:hypothetical protein
MAGKLPSRWYYLRGRRVVRGGCKEESPVITLAISLTPQEPEEFVNKYTVGFSRLRGPQESMKKRLPAITPMVSLGKKKVESRKELN